MAALSDFLQKNKIKPKAVLYTSRRLERMVKADYSLYLARKQKRAKAEEKSYAELEIAKPKSGRGLSERQLDAAIAGKELPKKVRAKVVRAVAALVDSKTPVNSQVLFGKGPTPKGTGKKKEAETEEPASS